MKVNVGGTWRNGIPSVNVGGTWRRAIASWINIGGGIWRKQPYSKPTITTQPVGGNITDAQTHRFTVAANAHGGTLRYQWYRNSVAIGGATASAYTAPRQSAGTYRYKCLVSDEVGSVWSSEVSLVVRASWAATHTITVGKSGDSWSRHYGFERPGASGTGTLGGLSPVTTGSYNIYKIMAQKTGNNYVTWATLKPRRWNKMKISWNGGRNSMVSNVIHGPAQWEVSYEFRNSKSFYDFLASHNGRGAQVRIEFL